MRLTQYSFFPVPPGTGISSPDYSQFLFFFFSPFSKGFYFCTVSRNVHYIVVSFHGSCFKHDVCHQQIWAKVQHGDELHLQDCHHCVLFPEQTSLGLLSTPRQKGLAGEASAVLSCPISTTENANVTCVCRRAGVSCPGGPSYNDRVLNSQRCHCTAPTVSPATCVLLGKSITALLAGRYHC